MSEGYGRCSRSAPRIYLAISEPSGGITSLHLGEETLTGLDISFLIILFQQNNRCMITVFILNGFIFNEVYYLADYWIRDRYRGEGIWNQHPLKCILISVIK